ncbi:sialidase family protein [Coraliomargarita sp. SDUM461004]|uniref:Sialidase family protein n=1 Tax=Thalassobacterium sedimentorum TaxID=3041258 RepID=A0ABU1AGE1_9BACT|nr:sialidase family protein [Coraliomargarita sp. SDUM461004]MDQ8192895.1 sialidase family protein [Coraliomargarita sp. SDUM461004]
MKRILLFLLAIPLIGSAEPSTSLNPRTSFLNPPEYVGPPDATRRVDNRAITEVSSIAITPTGRLWATWYAGVTPGEDRNNYVILGTSEDNGKSWEEVLVVDPDASGPVRAFDPEVWIAPDENLYWTWAQAGISKAEYDERIAGVWAIKITNPESPTPVYEAPARWTDGIMMCKPIVLSTGEWALPSSTWRMSDFSAQIVVSEDQGKTWTVRGGANVPVQVRNVDEHMIVERKDGSLWLLCRTAYGIGESISLDRGKSWSEVAPSKIAHTSSRFYIYRLQSGNLLLVKHGYIDEKTGRHHLRAFISDDDGYTWEGGLLLDERPNISYPDGDQAADGTIYLTYDYSRTGAREILFATFREEDALAGKDVSGEVNLRQLISKGSGGQSKDPKEKAQRSDNSDGVALIKKPAGALELDGFNVVPMAVGEVLFSDRQDPLKELPEALEGFSMLQVPREGRRVYTCSKEGMLYFLTPKPNRTWDSQEASLYLHGFEKVALPETLLFRTEASQLSSLYQKYCKVGETIDVGKWAVPLLAPKAP